MIEQMAGEFDKEYEVLVESEKTALEEEAKRSRELVAVLPFAGGSGNPSAPESLSDGITPDDTPGVRTPIAGEVNYAMGVQLARKPAIKRKASYAGSDMSNKSAKKAKVKVAVREVISVHSDSEDINELTTKENHLSISD